MPYIKKERRVDYDYALEDIRVRGIETAGELNYLMTMLCRLYLKQNFKNICYEAVNDIIGALESAKLEFYRKEAGPYENKKEKENGKLE